MKMEAVSLEAVHTHAHTHTICLVNKNIKKKIRKKLIKDSNNLKIFQVLIAIFLCIKKEKIKIKKKQLLIF